MTPLGTVTMGHASSLPPFPVTLFVCIAFVAFVAFDSIIAARMLELGGLFAAFRRLCFATASNLWFYSPQRCRRSHGRIHRWFLDNRRQFIIVFASTRRSRRRRRRR